MFRRSPFSFVLACSLAIGVAAPASTTQLRCEEVFEHSFTDDVIEQVTETTDVVKTRYQMIQEAMRLRWGRNFDPGLNPITPLRAGNYREATVRSLMSLYNHPARFLFGLEPLQLRSPVGKLLRRIWDQPELRITEAEEKLLSEHGLAEVVARQREFSKANPNWRVVRKNVDRSLFIVLTAALLLSIDHTLESVDHVLTFEDYLREPSWIGGTPVVHLLTESTPYPHSALRIGEKVYYYGMRRIDSGSVASYFKSTSSSPQQSRQWWMPAIFEGLFSNILQLGNFDRAVRFVEIKATPAQITAMRSELESRMGQRYFNFPPFTSEDTMLNKFLRRHTGTVLPSIIEMSPNLTQMNLLLNPLGSAHQFGRSGLLVPKLRSASFLIAKSILTDYLEIRLLMGTLLFGTPVREAFDLAYTEDALRWWDPPGAARVAVWKKEAAARLDQSLPGNVFEQELAAISKLTNGPEKTQRTNAARDRIRDLIAPLATEAGAAMKDDTSMTKDLLVAQAKLEILGHLAKSWNQILTGEK